MKIYLASGFTIMNNPLIKKKLRDQFPHWNRLYSFYFIKTSMVICNNFLTMKD